MKPLKPLKQIGRLKTYPSSQIVDSQVSIGFECLDRDLFDADKCYDLLGKSGIKYARCQTGWAKCEREKGIFDFSWLDHIVNSLLKSGVRPWFNVGYGNPLYMKDVPNPTAVGCVPLLYGDEVIEAWLRYVAALSEHFKTRVFQYEIWNEPDVDHFWYPGTADPAMYASLVKITGRVIREHVPNAQIGACMGTPYRFRYTECFFDHLLPEDIDFFSVHAYSTMPEFRYASAMAQHRRMMDGKGFSHVELWQGEAGYPSWAYKNHWLLADGGGSERAQAVFQLRRFLLDLNSGVSRSSYFQIADMWERPYEKAVEVLDRPAAQGILNGLTYTPKKAYETICALSALLRGGNVKHLDTYAAVALKGATACECLSTVVLTLEKDGIPMYAYYLPFALDAAAPPQYEADLEIVHPFKEPVLIDLYDRSVYAIESSVGTYEGSIHFANLTACDYPLIVTEKSLIEIE